MIGKLKGLIDSYGEDFVILDVGGVGYQVHCAGRTLQALPSPGEAAVLSIETYVREDQIKLFGFRTDHEREWFRLLQTVQGVGAKVALSVLGTLPPSELANAIALRDKASVARTPGVGPKVAERIVTELKDKAPAFANVDPAVVHLAGANVAAHRWSAGVKSELLESRTGPTRRLCEALSRLPRPPRTLVCASAIGIYGSRGDHWLDETATRGEGFLADICEAWEAATAPAQSAGIRVVHLRIGVVLTPRGGALGKLLLPFQVGAGGRIGDGRAYFSWIALDDLLPLVLHAICTPEVVGPLNAVAPNPVSNLDFTATLAAVLGRPALLPMPETALRFVLGEMAEEMLLASARVSSAKVQATGFTFRYPQLEESLRHLLGH